MNGMRRLLWMLMVILLLFSGAKGMAQDAEVAHESENMEDNQGEQIEEIPLDAGPLENPGVQDEELLNTFVLQEKTAEQDEKKEEKNIPKDCTIYYDMQRGIYGEAGYTWEQFFDYSPEEGITPQIANKTELVSNGYIVNEQETGFSIRVNEAAADSIRPVSVTLKCGSEWLHLKLQGINLQDMNQSVQIQLDSERVNAGECITVSALLPAEIAEQYLEAHAQNRDFPLPEEMVLHVQSENIKQNQEEKFIASENEWQARIIMDIPYTQAEELVSLSAKVMAGDQMIKEENVSCQIINQKPQLKEKLTSLDVTVNAGGVPEEWDGVTILKTIAGEKENVSLLKTAFGTDYPLELFEDMEGAPLTGKIMIETIAGSILPFGNNIGREGKGTQELELNDSLEEIMVSPAFRTMTYVVRLKVSDGVNESEELKVTVTVISRVARIAIYVAMGILALLLILVIILMIHQARKPRFDYISIRCLLTTSGSGDQCRELMARSAPAPLREFGKRAVTLADALVITRQPPVNEEYAEAVADISLLPARHGRLCIQLGKNARRVLGQVSSKEIIPSGNMYRLRMGKETIYIENVG